MAQLTNEFTVNKRPILVNEVGLKGGRNWGGSAGFVGRPSAQKRGHSSDEQVVVGL